MKQQYDIFHRALIYACFILKDLLLDSPIYIPLKICMQSDIDIGIVISGYTCSLLDLQISSVTQTDIHNLFILFIGGKLVDSVVYLSGTGQVYKISVRVR